MFVANPTVIPQLFVSSASATATPATLAAAGGAAIAGPPGPLIGVMGMAVTLETHTLPPDTNPLLSDFFYIYAESQSVATGLFKLFTSCFCSCGGKFSIYCTPYVSHICC